MKVFVLILAQQHFVVFNFWTLLLFFRISGCTFVLEFSFLFCNVFHCKITLPEDTKFVSYCFFLYFQSLISEKLICFNLLFEFRFRFQKSFLKVAIPLEWILILLLSVTHISIILSNVQAGIIQ